MTMTRKYDYDNYDKDNDAVKDCLFLSTQIFDIVIPKPRFFFRGSKSCSLGLCSDNSTIRMKRITIDL